jgi:hypothetical protein
MIVVKTREPLHCVDTSDKLPEFICSGGADPTLIPVGSERDAEELVKRVRAIVKRRSSEARNVSQGRSSNAIRSE